MLLGVDCYSIMHGDGGTFISPTVLIINYPLIPPYALMNVSEVWFAVLCGRYLGRLSDIAVLIRQFPVKLGDGTTLCQLLTTRIRTHDLT